MAIKLIRDGVKLTGADAKAFLNILKGPTCGCGDSSALGIEHRVGAPCYVLPPPRAVSSVPTQGVNDAGT